MTISKTKKYKRAYILGRGDNTMKRNRPLNDLGIWLMHELNRRDLSSKEFANVIQTTPAEFIGHSAGRPF